MHDMRQPLHGFSLMLDSLARLPQDEAASEIADVMRSAVGCLEVMLDSLSDVFRTESDTSDTEATAFPVGELFDNVRLKMRKNELVGLPRSLGVAPKTKIRANFPLTVKIVRAVIRNVRYLTEAKPVAIEGSSHAGWLTLRFTAKGTVPPRKALERSFIPVKGGPSSKVSELQYETGLGLLRALTTNLGCELDGAAGADGVVVVDLRLPLAAVTTSAVPADHRHQFQSSIPD